MYWYPISYKQVALGEVPKVMEKYLDGAVVADSNNFCHALTLARSQYGESSKTFWCKKTVHFCRYTVGTRNI